MKAEDNNDISSDEDIKYKGLTGKVIFINQRTSLYNVWKYFKCYKFESFNEEEEDQLISFQKCRCLLQECLKQNQWVSYNGNTSNMIKHLKKHHTEIYNNLEEAVHQKLENKEQDKQLKQNNLDSFIIKNNDSKSILFEISMMNILDNQPQIIVENTGFQRLLKLINNQYSPPCRKTLKNQLELIYSILVTHIKSNIEISQIEQNGFSLVWDHWKPKYMNQDLLSVILKYINNKFELKTFYLRVFSINDKTKDGIIEDLRNCLKSYNLLKDNEQQSLLRRFAMSDKASANVSAILNCDFLYQEHHLYCFSHTLHNSVLQGINISIANKLLTKINKNCNWFKDQTTSRHQQLEEVYNQLQLDDKTPFIKIKIINNTRWWTYNIMLRSFIRNFDAIKLFYNQQNSDLLDFEVTISEMKIVEQILELFNKLESTCLSLQENNFVTISKLLPKILKIQDDILLPVENESIIIKDLKSQLLSQFNKRIVSNYKHSFIILQSTSYLDTNFRDFIKTKYQSDLNSIHNFIIELSLNQKIFKTENAETKEIMNKKMEDESSLMKYIAKQMKEVNVNSSNKEDFKANKYSILNELEIYNQYQFQQTYINPLSFYQEKQQKFPILSQLVKSLFSLPSTSTIAEQHFSQMKNQITCLDGKKLSSTIEKQQFIKQCLLEKQISIDDLKQKYMKYK